MAAKKPAAAGSGWYALGRIDHDGTLYEAGDALPALDETTLAALRQAGVVSAVPPLADPEPTD